jgi:hypothetical protein
VEQEEKPTLPRSPGCRIGQANDHALTDDSRILSAYRPSLGEKIWIITEAVEYEVILL